MQNNIFYSTEVRTADFLIAYQRHQSRYLCYRYGYALWLVSKFITAWTKTSASNNMLYWVLNMFCLSYVYLTNGEILIIWKMDDSSSEIDCVSEFWRIYKSYLSANLVLKKCVKIMCIVDRLGFVNLYFSKNNSASDHQFNLKKLYISLCNKDCKAPEKLPVNCSCFVTRCSVFIILSLNNH